MTADNQALLSAIRQIVSESVVETIESRLGEMAANIFDTLERLRMTDYEPGGPTRYAALSRSGRCLSVRYRC
jgi:hypothetical protein